MGISIQCVSFFSVPVRKLMFSLYILYKAPGYLMLAYWLQSQGQILMHHYQHSFMNLAKKKKKKVTYLCLCMNISTGLQFLDCVSNCVDCVFCYFCRYVTCRGWNPRNKRHQCGKSNSRTTTKNACKCLIPFPCCSWKHL